MFLLKYTELLSTREATLVREPLFLLGNFNIVSKKEPKKFLELKERSEPKPNILGD